MAKKEKIACGKSTTDGSYVKGILKKEKGVNYIDGVPVHPWSIGLFFEKITPFKLKPYNPTRENYGKSM